jgi:hypothetical protein
MVDRILNIKSELRQMAKGDLLKMVFGQPERSCMLGGTCPFLLNYQQIRFCVSEVMDQGCQMEKLGELLSNEETQGREHNRDHFLDLTVRHRLPGLG